MMPGAGKIWIAASALATLLLAGCGGDAPLPAPPAGQETPAAPAAALILSDMATSTPAAAAMAPAAAQADLAPIVVQPAGDVAAAPDAPAVPEAPAAAIAEPAPAAPDVPAVAPAAAVPGEVSEAMTGRPDLAAP
ncbi:MAG: hypothetical protein ACKOWF_08785, partial [Chloroflexota bacterium]